MRTRGVVCLAAVVATAAAVFVPVSAQGEDLPAASPRISQAQLSSIKNKQIKSKYETSTRVVSRDGGSSVALPNGQSLWLFGDTSIAQKKNGAWKATGFIDGSTAIVAGAKKGVVPTGVETPTGTPKRFIPAPKGVYLPNGSGKPCTYFTAAFPARWPTGATMLGKKEVLITYSLVCVTTPSNVTQARAEGWGYLLYNWKTHKIDHGPVDVFKPARSGAKISPSKIYGSPIVSNGKVLMFASQCTKLTSGVCADGTVWMVSVAAKTAMLDKATSYKPVPLHTDGLSKWQPMSISVGNYGGVMRIVAQASIVGDFRIYSASSANGPWHLAKGGKLPGCPSHKGFCFALEGHPELSPSTHTFVSYKNPDSGPGGGHVVITAIPN